ncbi:hypothetical protein [Streptomyces sp. NBC_00338]|uniref:hypothetical protein n=1 Tax=Streptomyces sp. NBC_00338 TaxID=2975715 RepID=UPI0022560C58|nr:hypothetical protein [Streptomyces sp. NBC_00338]MCX5138349.1 hypothetical protein [Streptomyces sp. NBC_00338]MCX5145138.1 hypothetical protein [Streptomyces sp. NBC_00338]
MPDTTPTTPAPFRYVDEDDFHLSAHLVFNLPGTLSITIEGSDEPQSAHVPVGDLPRVLAGIAEAAGLAPARLVLGTTDQQPTTADKAAALGMAPTDYRTYRHDAAVEQIREAVGGLVATMGLRVMDALDGVPAQQPTAEAHRLALSEALGLGTGAPWDAIRDAAAGYRRTLAEADQRKQEYKTACIRLRAEVERLRAERTELIRQRDQISMDTIKALPAPVDRAAALTEAERTMLTYALDQAQERIWAEDGFTDEDQAAVTSLRRLADEAQQPETEAAKCTYCDGSGVDPDDEGDWVPEVQMHDPGSRGPCPKCNGTRTEPAADQPDTETEAQPFYRGGRCPVMFEGGGRCEKNADHRDGRWPDDPHTPEGHGRPIDQLDTETEAAKWAGATELAPDREIRALAATGLVGYRQGNGRLLHCLAHKPAPASRWADFHEVTADDLDDGGMCVHPRCGRDLLAAWPAP